MRHFAIALVGLVLGQPGNVLNGNWTATGTTVSCRLESTTVRTLTDLSFD